MKKKCKTPGANYNFLIKSTYLALAVGYGKEINLSDEEAVKLEQDLHDAVESVLAKFWVRKQ